VIFTNNTRSFAHLNPYIYFQSWKTFSTAFEALEDMQATSRNSLWRSKQTEQQRTVSLFLQSLP